MTDCLARIATPGVHAIWDTTGYAYLALTPLAAAAFSRRGVPVLVLSSEGLPERFVGLPTVSVEPISDESVRTINRVLHETAYQRTLIVETLNAAGSPATVDVKGSATGTLLMVATAESIHENWVPAPPLHRIPDELASRADTILTVTAVDTPHDTWGRDITQRQPLVLSYWERVSGYRGNQTVWFGNDLTITSTTERSI